MEKKSISFIINIIFVSFLLFSPTIAVGENSANIKQDDTAKLFVGDQIKINQEKEGDNISRKQIELILEKLNNAISQINAQHTYWTRWIEIAILILTAAILFMGLFNVITIRGNFNLLNKEREFIREELKLIKDNLKQLIDDRINKIGEELEKDISSKIDEQYLNIGNVYTGIWNNVAPLMITAMQQNDNITFMQLWTVLFTGQLALRQVLSSEEQVVLTGLGTLRPLAQQGLLPTEPTRNLFNLLRRQGRLQRDTQRDRMASNLLRDLR